MYVLPEFLIFHNYQTT